MVKLIDEAEEVPPQARSPLVVEIGSLLALEPDRTLETAFEQSDRL